MAKKKNNLTLEEKLQNALAPKGEQPYQIPDNWVWTRLTEAYTNVTSSKKKLKEKEYLINGEYPVIDQGKKKIGGYSNNKELLYNMDLPVIVFGDHTRSIKHIDFNFIQGADGVKVLKPKENWYPKCFYYALLSVPIQDLGYRRHFSVFKNYFIPLPPLLEQQRIVERIESLFSKLDEAKEKIQMSLDSFENRKSAILYKAFSGELTKKWREENGISLDDWEKIVLKDTLQNMTSKRPSGDYFCYIDIDSIDNHKQKVREPKMLETSKAPSRASRETLENDTLFSMVRPYLKNIAFIDRSLSGCIASTGFYVCRPNDKMYPKYLYLLLCSSDTINYTMKFMKGDNSPSIRKADLENMPVNIPSILEQKEIVRILDTIFEKEQDTQELIDLIENIDLMKKSILARAFRGELGTNLPEEESAMELLKSVLEV